MNQVIRNAVTGLSLCGLLCIAVIGQVQFRYEDRIHLYSENLRDLQKADAVLVLGGGLKPDGTPSDALEDRLRVGIYVYELALADRIVLTGDDGKFHQNEIEAMKKYVVDKGIPSEAIQVDGQGYRTYESCKHAVEAGFKRIFVVTQRFHIARAIFICSELGLQTEGIASDIRSYKNSLYYWVRDLIASAKAWWDIVIMKPGSPV